MFRCGGWLLKVVVVVVVAIVGRQCTKANSLAPVFAPLPRALSVSPRWQILRQT